MACGCVIGEEYAYKGRTFNDYSDSIDWHNLLGLLGRVVRHASHSVGGARSHQTKSRPVRIYVSHAKFLYPDRLEKDVVDGNMKREKRWLKHEFNGDDYVS